MFENDDTDWNPNEREGNTAPNDIGKRKVGRQAGAKGYSDEEVDLLLDIFEKYLPAGSNQWTAVAKSYNLSATVQGFSQRDEASLKQKFEKVSGAKKKTGSTVLSRQTVRSRKLSTLLLESCSVRSLGITPPNLKETTAGQHLITNGNSTPLTHVEFVLNSLSTFTNSVPNTLHPLMHCVPQLPSPVTQLDTYTTTGSIAASDGRKVQIFPPVL